MKFLSVMKMSVTVVLQMLKTAKTFTVIIVTFS